MPPNGHIIVTKKEMYAILDRTTFNGGSRLFELNLATFLSLITRQRGSALWELSFRSLDRDVPIPIKERDLQKGFLWKRLMALSRLGKSMAIDTPYSNRGQRLE